MTDAEVECLLGEVQQAVRGVARRYFHDSGQAEDLVQEHALVIWTKRGQLDASQNARAYVIAAMHYVCLRAKDRERTAHRAGYQAGGYESQEPTVGDEPVDAGGSFNHPLARGDEAATLRDMDIRHAFDELPSHLWIVAWLVHGEGFMVSEAATRLGLPRLIAAQRLTEATERLKERLQGWMPRRRGV